MGVASSAVPSSVRGECCAGFWILSLCFSEILSSPFGSLTFSLLVFQCIKSLHIGTVVFHPAYNFIFSVQLFSLQAHKEDQLGLFILFLCQDQTLLIFFCSLQSVEQILG